MVARSSAEAKYRAMAIIVCEMLWSNQLLHNLNISHKETMILHCDSKATIHISNNPIYHERTKYIEVEFHFLREKIQEGIIRTAYQWSIATS